MSVLMKMQASFIKYLMPSVYFCCACSIFFKFLIRVVGVTIKGKLKTPRCSI